jgi:hypothetical protein
MVLEKGLIQSMALEGTGQWADNKHGTGERADTIHGTGGCWTKG